MSTPQKNINKSVQKNNKNLLDNLIIWPVDNITSYQNPEPFLDRHSMYIENPKSEEPEWLKSFRRWQKKLLPFKYKEKPSEKEQRFEIFNSNK